MTLVAATDADVSPRTGEKPVDEFQSTRLFGWMQLDYGAIDLRVTRERGIPAPDSTDPVSPGVIVRDRGRPGSVARPILTMNSDANIRRPGQPVRTDGPGFSFSVFAVNGDGFQGAFAGGFLASDPSGYFCARQQRGPG
jgi:hypothetical protein